MRVRQIKLKIMKVIKRIKAPTFKFFKILRSIGLALLTISGTIVAGYMAVVGGVISAVSQMTVAEENLNKPRNGD